MQASLAAQSESSNAQFPNSTQTSRVMAHTNLMSCSVTWRTPLKLRVVSDDNCERGRNASGSHEPSLRLRVLRSDMHPRAKKALAAMGSFSPQPLRSSWVKRVRLDRVKSVLFGIIWQYASLRSWSVVNAATSLKSDRHNLVLNERSSLIS